MDVIVQGKCKKRWRFQQRDESDTFKESAKIEKRWRFQHRDETDTFKESAKHDDVSNKYLLQYHDETDSV